MLVEDNILLLYHNLLDCGLRKLTVCATRVRPILWVIAHIVIVHYHSIIICVNMNVNDYSRQIGVGNCECICQPKFPRLVLPPILNRLSKLNPPATWQETPPQTRSESQAPSPDRVSSRVTPRQSRHPSLR